MRLLLFVGMQAEEAKDLKAKTLERAGAPGLGESEKRRCKESWHISMSRISWKFCWNMLNPCRQLGDFGASSILVSLSKNTLTVFFCYWDTAAKTRDVRWRKQRLCWSKGRRRPKAWWPWANEVASMSLPSCFDPLERKTGTFPCHAFWLGTGREV